MGGREIWEGLVRRSECNGLYAILQHLPGAKGIGFEVEPTAFDLTTRNIAQLNVPIDLVRGSYKDLVGHTWHIFPTSWRIYEVKRIGKLRSGGFGVLRFTCPSKATKGSLHT
jgi:hypothetical protein